MVSPKQDSLLLRDSSFLRLSRLLFVAHWFFVVCAIRTGTTELALYVHLEQL